MVTALFKEGQKAATTTSLQKYDYGEVLRIKGLSLPRYVAVQFAVDGMSEALPSSIGETVEGVTDVLIPNSLLRSNINPWNYNIMAYVYIVSGSSGKTEYTITIPVKWRPKTGDDQAADDDVAAVIGAAVEKINTATQKAEAAANQAAETAAEISVDREQIQTNAADISELKNDLDNLKSTNGIDYKQISQELTKTKTVLNDTSSDGTCYSSGGVIKSNSTTGYKKMILPVAELPDIGNLIIPYDGLTNFFICGGELGDWGDTPSIVQTYTPSTLKTNGTLPVLHMGWNFTEGNDYAALDCAVMKSRIDSIPAFYFYIENNSNQWFVPFVLQDGIKKH